MTSGLSYTYSVTALNTSQSDLIESPLSATATAKPQSSTTPPKIATIESLQSNGNTGTSIGSHGTVHVQVAANDSLDALQMSVAVDSVVLVTRAGHTSGKLVMNAIANLQRFRGNLLGVILNRVDGRNQQEAYGYGYGYDGSQRPKQVGPAKALLD